MTDRLTFKTVSTRLAIALHYSFFEVIPTQLRTAKGGSLRDRTEFKRSLRALAKRYRNVRSDVEPIIDQVRAGKIMQISLQVSKRK